MYLFIFIYIYKIGGNKPEVRKVTQIILKGLTGA